MILNILFWSFTIINTFTEILLAFLKTCCIVWLDFIETGSLNLPGMFLYMDLTHSEDPVFFRAAGAVKLIKINRKTETVRSQRSWDCMVIRWTTSKKKKKKWPAHKFNSLSFDVPSMHVTAETVRPSFAFPSLFLVNLTAELLRNRKWQRTAYFRDDRRKI